MIPEAKHSSETFFQNQECYELNSRLTKCLDCKEKGKKKGRSKENLHPIKQIVDSFNSGSLNATPMGNWKQMDSVIHNKTRIKMIWKSGKSTLFMHRIL